MKSTKQKQEELRKRKQETGKRRGESKGGFGKDKPPKGGRNTGGRGSG